MTRRVQLPASALCAVFLTVVAGAQSHASEIFTATASVKTAGRAVATAPVTVTIERTMSREEADRFVRAFGDGDVAALRKALEGVPPTGIVQIGTHATPTRLTIERPTPNGRLLTIIADTPLLFLGGGVPGAKPRAGYDFGVIDLEIDANGAGTGTLAPAAKITTSQGMFVVKDYADEVIRLTAVARRR
jgi:hypothetical protein